MNSETFSYDIINYIGRFEPFHRGHLETLKKALELSRFVFLLLGSSNLSRNIKNPWTSQEREDMIRAMCEDESIDQKRIRFIYINDYTYSNNIWLEEVQAKVNATAKSLVIPGETEETKVRIGLIGFKRDRTSDYLDQFPQWKTVPFEEVGKINATAIREAIFSTTGYFNTSAISKAVLKDVPRGVMNWISDFFIFNSDIAENLRRELQHVEKYKQAWANSPYPPAFITADSVVTQSGHILLVKRGAMPGEGLWALPGGFINSNERAQDAAIRELEEETKIKISRRVLVKSIKAQNFFDDPDRSIRGRTVTFAFHIALDPVPDGLPKVKGSDDARHSMWVPFAEFKQMENQMFEDHFAIASYFIGNSL